MLGEMLRRRKARALEDSPKICFVHVPKCAGSALCRAIQHQAYGVTSRLAGGHFVLHTQACAAAADGEGLAFPRLAAGLAGYHLAKPGTVFIRGHFHCAPDMLDRHGDQWRFMTVLRKPVDRFISAFVYDSHKTGGVFRNAVPIEEFLETERARYEGRVYLHHFSDFAKGEKRTGDAVARSINVAVDTLERFALVGTLDRMDRWLDDFARLVGRKITMPTTNRSPKPELAERIRGDKAIMRRIEALCEPDQAVYDRIASLR